MRKIINNPDNFVDEMIEGLILAHPGLLRLASADNRVLVRVDSPVALQIERACARDGNQADQIQRIIDAQMPREEKLSRADIVLDNGLSLDSLATRVAAIHQTLLSLPNIDLASQEQTQ